MRNHTRMLRRKVFSDSGKCFMRCQKTNVRVSQGTQVMTSLPLLLFLGSQGTFFLGSVKPGRFSLNGLGVYERGHQWRSRPESPSLRNRFLPVFPDLFWERSAFPVHFLCSRCCFLSVLLLKQVFLRSPTGVEPLMALTSWVSTAEMSLPEKSCFSQSTYIMRVYYRDDVMQMDLEL